MLQHWGERDLVKVEPVTPADRMLVVAAAVAGWASQVAIVFRLIGWW